MCINNTAKTAGQDAVGRNDFISEAVGVVLGRVGDPKSRALSERIGQSQAVKALGRETWGNSEELARMYASAEYL